jgi:hypothetical protein
MIKKFMFSIGILCLLSCSSNKQLLNSDVNDVGQMNRTTAKEVDSVKVIPVANKFNTNQKMQPKGEVRSNNHKKESMPLKKK